MDNFKIMETLEKLGEIEEYPSNIYDNIIYCNENVLSSYFGKEIPKDFVAFSEKYGAFRFKNGVLIKVKSTEKNTKNIVNVDYFVSVYGEKFTIMHIIDAYKEQISKTFLPFCEGTSGDLIGIRMTEKNYGKIYYWSHEGPVTNSYHLIANSFGDFLQRLFIEEIEPDKNNPIDQDFLKTLSPKFLEKLRESGII